MQDMADIETRVLDLLWQRKGTRAISGRPVEREKVEAMLEAARLAPSCRNNQPWRFLVLDEPEAPEKGRATLSKVNGWAATAPLLVAAYSRPDLDCRSRDGREFYLFDLGLAVENLMLQATELDLVARPMAGFSQRRLKAAFGVPDECVVAVVVAVGYEGDVSALSEEDRRASRAPRRRRPLGEIVRFNRLE